MSQDKIIIRFDEVSFEYGHAKPILDEVSFSVRQGMKFALMGQNGAGKSTLFTLITGDAKPDSGKVSIDANLSIATARQVIPRDQLDLTVREFFEKRFSKKAYDIDPKIDAVLDIVHLSAPRDRIIKSFSGGQQARLLLASALIQNPDILLLDEPTNNLDKEGIAHLTDFLKKYQKTVVVISHDAEFLNSFTDGVLYLDVFTRKIERYVGNYFDAVNEISARIEKENSKNAQLAKEIQENKDKANFFAQKGGGMRMVAKRMRDKAEKLEEEKVDVRREDKTIRHFTIPAQQDLTGEIIRITSFTTLKNHKPTAHKTNISLKKNNHLLLSGPNGIGKSTLLELITENNAPGISVAPRVRIGYYRQDFSTLNFDDTVYDSLFSIMKERDEHEMRSTAAGFLITAESMRIKIGDLSEGQKGLVAFARLVLQKPGLLILDEPTNHINFRHIPLIAEALNTYQGAMILVSHVPSFVKKIRIDEVLDLEKL
ncbi:MAG: ABC-F family ATP-binding cassette domain-containing protein [Patescibacteria group bacterium]